MILRSDVGPSEQITEGFAPKQGEPAAPAMLGPVVDHVAALTEGGEVGVRVIAGVVVAMGGSQHDPGRTNAGEHIIDPQGWTGDPSSPVTPRPGVSVPPAAIAEVVDDPSMGALAGFAAALGPAEADRDRELRPVDRIEKAMLGADRHGLTPDRHWRRYGRGESSCKRCSG